MVKKEIQSTNKKVCLRKLRERKGKKTFFWLVAYTEYFKCNYFVAFSCFRKKSQFTRDSIRTIYPISFCLFFLLLHVIILVRLNHTFYSFRKVHSPLFLFIYSVEHDIQESVLLRSITFRFQ